VAKILSIDETYVFIDNDSKLEKIPLSIFNFQPNVDDEIEVSRNGDEVSVVLVKKADAKAAQDIENPKSNKTTTVLEEKGIVAPKAINEDKQSKSTQNSKLPKKSSLRGTYLFIAILIIACIVLAALQSNSSTSQGEQEIKTSQNEQNNDNQVTEINPGILGVYQYKESDWKEFDMDKEETVIYSDVVEYSVDAYIDFKSHGRGIVQGLNLGRVINNSSDSIAYVIIDQNETGCLGQFHFVKYDSDGVAQDVYQSEYYTFTISDNLLYVHYDGYEPSNLDVSEWERWDCFEKVGS